MHSGSERGSMPLLARSVGLPMLPSDRNAWACNPPSKTHSSTLNRLFPDPNPAASTAVASFLTAPKLAQSRTSPHGLGGASDLFHILFDLLSGIVGHFERHVGYPTAALQGSFHG